MERKLSQLLIKIIKQLMSWIQECGGALESVRRIGGSSEWLWMDEFAAALNSISALSSIFVKWDDEGRGWARHQRFDRGTPPKDVRVSGSMPALLLQGLLKKIYLSVCGEEVRIALPSTALLFLGCGCVSESVHSVMTHVSIGFFPSVKKILSWSIYQSFFTVER